MGVLLLCHTYVFTWLKSVRYLSGNGWSWLITRLVFLQFTGRLELNTSPSVSCLYVEHCFKSLACSVEALVVKVNSCHSLTHVPSWVRLQDMPVQILSNCGNLLINKLMWWELWYCHQETNKGKNTNDQKQVFQNIFKQYILWVQSSLFLKVIHIKLDFHLPPSHSSYFK